MSWHVDDRNQFENLDNYVQPVNNAKAELNELTEKIRVAKKDFEDIQAVNDGLLKAKLSEFDAKKEEVERFVMQSDELKSSVEKQQADIDEKKAKLMTERYEFETEKNRHVDAINARLDIINQAQSEIDDKSAKLKNSTEDFESKQRRHLEIISEHNGNVLKLNQERVSLEAEKSEHLTNRNVHLMAVEALVEERKELLNYRQTTDELSAQVNKKHAEIKKVQETYENAMTELGKKKDEILTLMAQEQNQKVEAERIVVQARIEREQADSRIAELTKLKTSLHSSI